MEEKEKIDFESDSLEPIKKEKIGFSSDPNDNPNDKNNKTKQKFKRTKKTPIRRICGFFFALGFLFTITTLMYLFLPLFNGLLIITVVLILGTIIVLCVTLTLFLILASDGFREWVGKSWSIVEWLSDFNSNLVKLNPYFLYFAYPAIILDSLTILLAIIGRAKEKKGYIGYIVLMTISIILCTLFIIFYFANGKQIMT